MAEQRKKHASILLTVGGNQPVSLELFPAEQWASKPGAAPGLFRVRQGGKWVARNGDKYTFMTPAMAAMLVANMLAADTLAETPVAQAPRPDLPVGTHVRVANGNVFDGAITLHDCTRTATAPFQGADGQWYVHVLLYGRGLVPVPCTAVKRR